jgi:hypothetical protein
VQPGDQIARAAQLAQPSEANVFGYFTRLLVLLRGGTTLAIGVLVMQGPSLQAAVHICVDCSEHSPQTETNYTLISSRYGWRLSLEEGPSGKRLAIWRCPNCWQRFRGR